METHLPAPISKYLEAINRHDPDAMLAQFSDDAIVKDEGKTRRGRAAVTFELLPDRRLRLEERRQRAIAARWRTR